LFWEAGDNLAGFFMCKFDFLQTGLSWCLHQGKSGQHRAAYRLSAGVPQLRKTESATENDSLIPRMRNYPAHAGGWWWKCGV